MLLRKVKVVWTADALSGGLHLFGVNICGPWQTTKTICSCLRYHAVLSL